MDKRRACYLFISTTMVLVYLVMYAMLYRPNLVNAQTACFQMTLESCPGSGCVPGCIGIPEGPLVTGYTSGPYGVPVNTIICKE